MFIHIFSIVTLIVVQLVFSPQSYAQQQKPAEVPQATAVSTINSESIAGRIKEIREKLEVAETAENEETAARFGITLTKLQEHNANLRETEAIYQQQLTSLERQSSLAKEEQNLDKKLQSWQESLVAQPPPYNLSTYDSLLDELTTTTRQEQTINAGLKETKKQLEEAKAEIGRTGHKVREIEEEIQQEKQTEKSLPQLWILEYTKAEDELAQAVLDLLRINLENKTRELTLVQMQKEITQRHVNWFKSNLDFDATDLQNRLDILAEQRVKLQSRVETLRQEQKGIENAWLDAQSEFDVARGADEDVKERASAMLKAREAWRETYQEVLEQTENMLLFLNQEEQVWQRRYSLLEKDIDYEELDKWQQATTEQIERINRNIITKDNYQQDLQAEIAAIQKQLSENGMGAVIAQQIETQIAALNKMADRNFEYLTLLQRAREIEQRFLNEIDDTQQNVALMKKIHWVGEKIESIWEYELWVVDERSVTVHKVVVALFILIVGMLLARWFTQYLVRRILSRTRLDENVTAAMEKMLYFFALLVLLVFALQSVNIPLAVFTLFGGAIAIAVGFGAQKLLNNFVSGFILLAERPVKINDMIEVENNFGIIEKIGMRCTRVRTPGNVHILVPNSSFLEKNIVNWTLSDHEIRGIVKIGVAYNSDPREVQRIMLQAVQEHERILKKPEPEVFFDEVGESSLNFTVFFWVRMNKLVLLEQRTIESDVRYRLIELFREAGIEMAYPQRDLHLDTSKPLDLQLVGAQPPIMMDSVRLL